MTNAKCRSCDHAADASAYCSSCAADIMAKAFNPFYGGRRKKLSPGKTQLAPQMTEASRSFPGQFPLFKP